MAEESDISAARVTPIALSTGHWKKHDRFDAWQEEVSRCITGMEVRSEDRPNFQSDILAMPLPNLMISRSRFSKSRLSRTPTHMRDGDDSVVLAINLEDESFFGSGDRQMRMTRNCGILVTSDLKGGFSTDVNGNACSLRLSRDMLRLIAPDWERALLREITADNTALNLLRTYMLSILAEKDISAPVAQLADQQLRELLAFVLNPSGDLTRAAVYGGVKAARLRTIQDDIARHFSHPGLSAAEVGARLGISGRYVQQLLEGAGTSFSHYVRTVRLDYARQLLRDPLMAHKRISDICEMAGFADLSYFNHAFRAGFGHTPKDERRGTARHS